MKNCMVCWTDNAEKNVACLNCGEILSHSFASDLEFLEELENLVEDYAGEPEQGKFYKLLHYAKQLVRRTDISCPDCGCTEMLCGHNGVGCTNGHE